MQVYGVLDMIKDYNRDNTYHTESADKFLRGLDTSRDDHLDEVGADADYHKHGKGLETASTNEHQAQRLSIVGWDRHIGD
jgi:hypothetical protein